MNRRSLLLASLYGVGGVGALTLRPRKDRSQTPDLAALVPDRIGEWRATPASEVVLPTQDMLSKAIYDGYFARGYSKGQGRHIVLLIAYGADQSYALQVHRPEVCYPASGFRVSETREITAAGGTPAGFLTAVNGRIEEAVLYWIRVGNSFPRTSWGQRREIVEAILAGRPAEGILVRLSIRNVSRPVALASLTQFATQLRDSLSPEGRNMLLRVSPSPQSERSDHG